MLEIDASLTLTQTPTPSATRYLTYLACSRVTFRELRAYCFCISQSQPRLRHSVNGNRVTSSRSVDLNPVMMRGIFIGCQSFPRCETVSLESTSPILRSNMPSCLKFKMRRTTAISASHSTFRPNETVSLESTSPILRSDMPS